MCFAIVSDPNCQSPDSEEEGDPLDLVGVVGMLQTSSEEAVADSDSVRVALHVLCVIVKFGNVRHSGPTLGPSLHC